MVGSIGILSIIVGGFVYSGVELGAAFGRGDLFNGGLLGGQAARHTTVVSRAPLARPYYTERYSSSAFPSQPILDDLPRVGRDPFVGSRAAVSGDVIGLAPSIAPIPKRSSGNVVYHNGGSLLGESLGLVPVNRGGLRDSTGYGAGVLAAPRLPNVDLPGFPTFESDGYIVHDQRGRQAPSCGPGECNGPADMSPDMQSMYDKYKRYYRNYGPENRVAPALDRLIDPVPFHMYDRIPSASINTPSHFTATSVSDGRNGGTRVASGRYSSSRGAAYGGSIPVAARGQPNGTGNNIPLAAGGAKSRDSFFGTIYDVPDVATIDDYEEDVIYESPMADADDVAYEGSSVGQRAAVAGFSEPPKGKYDHLPIYPSEGVDGAPVLE